MDYGYKKQLNVSYETAVNNVKEALKKEGFGVLTEIDMKTTLKNKMDVDIGNYAILGACNPPFAYRAVQAEQDIGLLLPCNVIVYELDGKSYVSAILPTAAMNMVENEELAGLAVEVEKKLKAAVDSL